MLRNTHASVHTHSFLSPDNVFIADMLLLQLSRHRRDNRTDEDRSREENRTHQAASQSLQEFPRVQVHRFCLFLLQAIPYFSKYLSPGPFMANLAPLNSLVMPLLSRHVGLNL